MGSLETSGETLGVQVVYVAPARPLTWPAGRLYADLPRNVRTVTLLPWRRVAGTGPFRLDSRADGSAPHQGSTVLPYTKSR